MESCKGTRAVIFFIISGLSAYTEMYVERRVCHEEKCASGIDDGDWGAAADPFYPDSFVVCPEQESGGGEYIRGDGGERGKEPGGRSRKRER